MSPHNLTGGFEMRALMIGTALATIALATPAAAGDLLYPGGTLLSEGAIGKPVWEIQAECAGLFGAEPALHLAHDLFEWLLSFAEERV